MTRCAPRAPNGRYHLGLCALQAKKVEKAREGSRKAEQLAVAKAKADRESAKERSASALALLQVGHGLHLQSL